MLLDDTREFTPAELDRMERDSERANERHMKRERKAWGAKVPLATVAPNRGPTPKCDDKPRA